MHAILLSCCVLRFDIVEIKLVLLYDHWCVCTKTLSCGKATMWRLTRACDTLWVSQVRTTRTSVRKRKRIEGWSVIKYNEEHNFNSLGYPCYAPHLSISRNTIIWFFNRESIKKQFFIVDFLHALYKRKGYVIIPKPHFSSREGIISRCRYFDLLRSPFWLNLTPLGPIWSLLSPLM